MGGLRRCAGEAEGGALHLGSLVHERDRRDLHAQPRTIHDFFGFPEELFSFDYPAPGAPDVAELVSQVVKPTWVGLDRDSWGIDHGTWSVLAHVFPDADVPVVQLSINALQSLGYHLDLGTRLAPLREQGIAIVCSGNVVHNLRRIAWDQPDGAYDWNARFDEAAATQLFDAPEDLLRLQEHPDFTLAVPTPDHFIPLLHLAGISAATGTTASVLVGGPSLGSLSMASYVIGDAPCPEGATGASAALPGPDVTPPEDTNA